VEKGYTLKQLDVKTAFLNGDLNEEPYHSTQLLRQLEVYKHYILNQKSPLLLYSNHERP
jgi:hypothetical protein